MQAYSDICGERHQINIDKMIAHADDQQPTDYWRNYLKHPNEVEAYLLSNAYRARLERRQLTDVLADELLILRNAMVADQINPNIAQRIALETAAVWIDAQILPMPIQRSELESKVETLIAARVKVEKWNATALATSLLRSAGVPMYAGVTNTNVAAFAAYIAAFAPNDALRVARTG
jgi:hypothetical protein